MTRSNRTRLLAFSDRFVSAELVEEVAHLRAEGVVINLSNDPMVVDGHVQGTVPAWKSTILRGATIIRATRVAIIRVREETNLGAIALGNDNWQWFGKQMAEFPRDTPLYISRHDIVGEVSLNPYKFANTRDDVNFVDRYDIRLNLWWAPGKTDAVLHNQHPFLEIHTQIHGLGRIQIFRERDEATLYREITTAPGDTHDPIVCVVADRQFAYPWHRGWTDTDAIWLAIELHPKD